ncbi:hypothetical protein SAMN04487970_101689 [Paenibacillus tianmuensis]|uniref:Lipoprotein n=1 Tax=Paenibacillus tianmuensis TaxID=624147 RepID=A0A1G4RL49_9BACL|nr:hypothetical protein SAMN04487970_101689 [Paenibacillus tianmuensis]
MRIKNYILSITCIFLILLATACESESDKRKARLKQLDKEINQLKKETNLMNDYLDACEKVSKC